MRDSIAKAVHLFRNAPELNDEEVFERLIAEGIERKLAASLLHFIPMVYVRILFERKKVRFSEFYEQQLPSGRKETRRLTAEPVWIPTVEFARAEIGQGISAQDLLNVAGRSAEGDALNQALNRGNNIEDGSLGMTIVPWRE